MASLQKAMLPATGIPSLTLRTPEPPRVHEVATAAALADRSQKAAPFSRTTGLSATAAVTAALARRRRRQRSSRQRSSLQRCAARQEQPLGSRRREAILAPAASALLGAAAPSKASTSSIKLPNFGVGTWAWGDSLFWGYDQKEDPSLQESFNFCLEQGVKLFDTAELYGVGRSEDLLGKFFKEKGGKADDVVVATKFAALPWKLSRGDVVSACKASAQRLGTGPIDLYQIHFPGPWHNEDFWDGLGDCYEQGLVKAVGVSNYGSSALRGIHKRLSERGIPLASNQIQYSLVYRFPELNGMKDTCDELGVKILAYSPLGLGSLTGKYSKDKLPSGPRAQTLTKFLEDPAYSELLSTMRTTAAKHGEDMTLSQVAIAWCLAKNTIPIPGVRNVRQATDNLKALSLGLTAGEVQELDAAASKLKPVLSPDVAPFVKESVDTKAKFFEA